MGYSIILLKDMIDILGESKVKQMLSSFCCPLNKDIEYFLKNKAIETSKQNLAPTHLVYTSYRSENVLIGYFTLNTKTFTIKRHNMPCRLFSRIKKYGIYDSYNKEVLINAPLIAQLGKDFYSDYDKLIKGDELLLLACNKVAETHKILGGKIVYIECEDKPKLTKFYTSNGFFNFGKRNLDRDERDKLVLNNI